MREDYYSHDLIKYKTFIFIYKSRIHLMESTLIEDLFRKFILELLNFNIF